MSELFFRCPHCGQEIESPDDMAGTMINCPSCDGLLRVPGELHPGAEADMIFQCPVCRHGIDTPVGAAGLHLTCPKCGMKIPVPSPKPKPVAPAEPAVASDPAPTEPVDSEEPPPPPPVPAAEAPQAKAPFNGAAVGPKGLDHEKKGATARIDLPEGDSAPRPQMRVVTIKRAGGTQAGHVPRQIHLANGAAGSKKNGGNGLFHHRG